MPWRAGQQIVTFFNCSVLPLAITLFMCLNVGKASSQLIGTVAGNGGASASGNGSLATCAGVPAPSGVIVDANGNMFIVSPNSIRKVNALDGNITTLAGFTNAGFSGDGGPSTSAMLDYPRSVCLDISGNIYIGELNGHRIRKIDALTGIISTIAGTGTAGYSGDGGPATAAMIRSPYDIKADHKGNLYVADYQNARIRKINLSTGIITTVAGTGATIHSGDGGLAINAGLAQPSSVCIDASDNIFFSEVSPTVSTRIRKISGVTGVVTTIAGSDVYGSSGDGGPATLATLMRPLGLCADASGNIYFSDYDASRIRKINVATGLITTMAGNGSNGYGGDGNPAAGSILNGPIGICSDNSGNIFFADNGNNRVRKLYINLTSPPPSTPSVLLTANSTSACSGIPVVITATVTNGTPNMIYQWFRNGNSVGTNSNVYTPSSLNNGDVIYCMITSNSCNGVLAIKSNSITLTGSVIPVITISASATTVCPGTTVQFTATANNCGPNPTYQWKVNSLNVGTNHPVYTRVLINSGDNITCELTPDPTISCINRSTVYSNQIGITVTVGVTGSIDIFPSANEVCPGIPVTFTAVVQNASSTPSYQWKVNGVPVGSNLPVYVSSSLSNNDKVQCYLTSGSNNCNALASSSPTIVMSVKKVPSIFIVPPDTVVAPGSQILLHAEISGAYASYIWNPSTLLNNSTSLSPTTYPSQSTTAYQLSVTTDEGCKAYASSWIRVKKKLYLPNAFTPNGDGLNDVFRIPPGGFLKLISFSIFDRWGNVVFMTYNVNAGWDGRYKGIKKDPGTYLYLIQAYDGNEKILLKGSVTLIR